MLGNIFYALSVLNDSSSSHFSFRQSRDFWHWNFTNRNFVPLMFTLLLRFNSVLVFIFNYHVLKGRENWPGFICKLVFSNLSFLS